MSIDRIRPRAQAVVKAGELQMTLLPSRRVQRDCPSGDYGEMIGRKFETMPNFGLRNRREGIGRNTEGEGDAEGRRRASRKKPAELRSAAN